MTTNAANIDKARVSNAVAAYRQVHWAELKVERAEHALRVATNSLNEAEMDFYIRQTRQLDDSWGGK